MERRNSVLGGLGATKQITKSNSDSRS
jgi:hypothetical protein